MLNLRYLSKRNWPRVLLALLPIAAYAQVAQLPIQQVSATGLQQALNMSPAAITVIDAEQLQRQPLMDLAEVFRDVPGVTLVDADVPGMKRIRIRGDSARRVLIKIDNQPLSDHTSRGTPLLIDPSWIERIEVVRGSASVVHGSNAAAGVVNIITRRPSEGRHEPSVNTAYYGATQGHRYAANAVGEHRGWQYRLNYSEVEHGDRRTPQERLQDSDYQLQSWAMHLAKQWQQHRLGAEYDQFNLTANTYMGDTGLDSMRFPQRDQQRVALTYDYDSLVGALQHWHARVYQQQTTRVMTTSFQPIPIMTVDLLADDDLQTDGMRFQSEWHWQASQPMLLGIEWQRDQLQSDKSTTTKNLAPIPVVIRSYQQAEQVTWSVFGQQNWQLSSDWSVFAGARWYQIDSQLMRSTERRPEKNHTTESVASLGLVYALSAASTWRANVAQGFSYPSLVQLYSMAKAGNSIDYGNAYLRPEQMTTAELGWRFQQRHWDVDITAYHNQAIDFIDRQRIDSAPEEFTTTSPANTIHRQWANIDRVRSRGLEWRIQWHGDRMQPYWQGAWQHRRMEYGNGVSTKHSGVAPWQWTLAWPVQVHDRYLITFEPTIRHVGEQTAMDATGQKEQVRAFTTINLGVTSQPLPSLVIRVMAGNLTNKTYRYLTELTAPQRHIDVDITWSF